MTGKVASVNPKIFKIINGKLYLSWDTDGADKFEDNADNNIRKADQNWKKLTTQ